MKVLILGGREFLGRHLVEAFTRNSYEVTLFNRGKTNSHLFSELETIIGDRHKDLSKLQSRDWDIVVDTSGYHPANVGDMAKTLSSNVKHYIFISSCSVYDLQPQSLCRDENAQLVNLDIDIDNLEPLGKDYGACKYLSELAISENFNGLVTHIRAGLIVGPYDSTARFPYWVHRLNKGGKAIAPPPNYLTKFIDARDIADWCVLAAKNQIEGIFNMSGPEYRVKEFLDQANSILGNKTELHYCSEDFLKENNIQCWTELPLWVTKEIEAFMQIDSGKAVAAGLSYRSIKDTLKDTLEWLINENIQLSDLKYQTLDSQKEEETLLKMSK